jgi:hypothetical protein
VSPGEVAVGVLSMVGHRKELSVVCLRMRK